LSLSGQFLIDDTFLAGEGVTDFDAYRVDPSQPLSSDFFMPDSRQPPAGREFGGEGLMLARVTAQPDHRNREASHDLPQVQASRTAPVPLSSNQNGGPARAGPQTKRTARVSADQDCSNCGGVIVDPFGGAGTTLIAAADWRYRAPRRQRSALRAV
jgi:hypothetical protein